MTSRRKKRKLGSYPSVSVVGSMLLALFVIGLFGIFLTLSNNLKDLIRQNMQAQVYLQKDLSESQLKQVEQTLSSALYVLKKDGEAVMTFVSREDAARKFIEETGEEFFELLGDNPLRDSYLYNISLEYQEPARLDSMRASVEAIPGVFEIDYVETMMNQLVSNTTTISIILISFAGILIIAVVLLINNTIKLALFSQRFLIRSMQLVGAKASFIQRPFLVRSAFHGILAAVIAGSGLILLINYGTTKVPELGGLYDLNSLAVVAGGLVLLGIIVGTGGTYLAIRRYLKMSLDELY